MWMVSRRPQVTPAAIAAEAVSHAGLSGRGASEGSAQQQLQQRRQQQHQEAGEGSGPGDTLRHQAAAQGGARGVEQAGGAEVQGQNLEVHPPELAAGNGLLTTPQRQSQTAQHSGAAANPPPFDGASAASGVDRGGGQQVQQAAAPMPGGGAVRKGRTKAGWPGADDNRVRGFYLCSDDLPQGLSLPCSVQLQLYVNGVLESEDEEVSGEAAGQGRLWLVGQGMCTLLVAMGMLDQQLGVSRCLPLPRPPYAPP